MAEDIRQQEDKAGGEQEKQEKKKKQPAVLILKGAASFTSRGEKFIKGVPREVADESLAERLLASGLFERAGGKK